MLIPDQLNELFVGLRAFKQASLVTNTESGDMEPTMLVFTEGPDSDGEPISLPLGEPMTGAVELIRQLNSNISPMPPVVFGMVTAVRHAMDAAETEDRITAVAIGSEVMFLEERADADRADEVRAFYAHGDLEREWATNPQTRVRQGINMLVVEDDLCGGWNFAIVLQEYVRTDGGGISWGERHSAVDLDPGMGNVSAAVLRALTVDLSTLPVLHGPGSDKGGHAIAIPLHEIVEGFIAGTDGADGSFVTGDES